MSVVVPVRDRRALLRQLLDALASQTLADHEVVVVDDGSVDGSADEAEADARAGRPVRVIRGDGWGAVAARRLGVEVARSDLLAFTDSDCVPDAGWLAAGVAALEAGADLAHGPTRPARPPRPLERTVADLGSHGLYPTCNVFYRRSAYEAAGGFDVDGNGGLGFGEDTRLAWRVRRAGVAVLVPEATVVHHVFPVDLGESIRRAWMVRGFPALVRAVPELRGTLLYGRVFLGGASRAPLYAGVIGLATRRRRLARLGLAGWVAWRALPLARDRGLKKLPVDLALDGLAGVALVVGSARERTVVL